MATFNLFSQIYWNLHDTVKAFNCDEILYISKKTFYRLQTRSVVYFVHIPQSSHSNLTSWPGMYIILLSSIMNLQDAGSCLET